ncbi:hypothetical protein CDL15_Pgr001795 [Punica granatum]|uniref:TF-B3 domain-containing protein n=1 Tax=Punica granatum TaxID=22663 RepID=A0A218XCI9_PUNGR|nr:hypothetical protein CDL15_Pgr001795 [Punica granatum]
MPMASKRRRGAVKLQHGSFRSAIPRFFKVMVGESLDRSRIEIPPKFIRKYGDRLPHLVLLKAQNGESFRVKVEEAEGKVWLGRGWRKFESHYAIMEGSFLVFQLERSDVLRVLIFDSSATEIAYPPANRSHNQRPMLNNEAEESGDDDDDALLEGRDASEPAQKRSRRSRRFQRSMPTKQLPIEDSDDSSTYLPSEQSAESESETESSELEYRRTTSRWKRATLGQSLRGVRGLELWRSLYLRVLTKRSR